MNYNGKMNLLRFKNAFVISVKGRNETKKGVFISDRRQQPVRLR